MSAKPRIFSNIVENSAAKPPSNYGLRTDPFTGQEKKHDGVDISTPVGTPINAPADGVIYYVGNGMSGYGNVVVLAHPNATNPTSFTLYAHLKDDSTKPEDIGRQVNAGDQIAESGNTGSRSTGPHLHYEERTVRPGGAVAPLPESGTKAAFKEAIDAIKNTVLSAIAVDPRVNQLGFGTWDPSKVDREDLTRLERVAQLMLSDNEFESYKTQLASIETKGKSLEDGQLMRMALMFNQMVNTAEPEAHAPLGFVPIAPETQWHDIALMPDGLESTIKRIAFSKKIKIQNEKSQQDVEVVIFLSSFILRSCPADEFLNK